MKLQEWLRATIKTSGKTRYRIGKDTNIHATILLRFIHDERRNLDGGTIDKLCEYFGLPLPQPRQHYKRNKVKDGSNRE